ncbi:MAG: sigma-70 family RNA polymerase sigma factor [Verrucomicrobiota bacterium]
MKTRLFSSLGSLFSLTDEQAMWRVQMHDDAEAFAYLVEKWEEPIQRLCVRMLGDPHRAEDLTQEAFSRIFARRKEYQPAGKFSTFLWRVALNLCYDELRRLKRRKEEALQSSDSESDAFPAVGPAPDEMAVAREQAEMVREALLQLPEAYRSVLVLRHYENLKFREIAEVLDIPEGTVKSRMAEALTQLGRLLARAVEPKNNLWKIRRIEENLML